MNHPRIPFRAGLLALALAVAGCDGSKESSLTVTPSLGVVHHAEVVVTDLAGRELGSGRIGGSGELVLDLDAAALANGFVVELHGGDDATYYDEGAREWRPLPAGSTLHAASTGERARIAVTALTEVAWQRARQLAGGRTPAAAQVAQANAEVAEWLARVPLHIGGDGSVAYAAGDPDILAPAQPVDGGERLSSDSHEGRYAILLAALAQRAHAGALAQGDACAADARCSPLLPLIAYLATDFADGVLDDRNPLGTSQGLPFIDPDVDPVETFPEAEPGTAGGPLDDPTPQEEVGREFAGNWSLACSGGETATLTIGPLGDITLASAAGGAVLPHTAFNVAAPLTEFDYRIDADGKAFTARLLHTEGAGPLYTFVPDVVIDARATGAVRLTRNGHSTDCTTHFTQGEAFPAKPAYDAVLDARRFTCLVSGGGPLTPATLEIGADRYAVNGTVQTTRASQASVYRHRSIRESSWQMVPAGYEVYEWGRFGEPQFASFMRAATRYEGVAGFTVFDLQSVDNLQGLVGCEAGDTHSLAEYFGAGNSIVASFGGTSLQL